MAASAAVATFTSTNNASAYVGTGVVTPNGGNVTVSAETTSPLTVTAYGGQIGGACVGAAIASATENGTTQAYINGAMITPANLTISATANNPISATSKAGTVGVVAGTWNMATATANPTVSAYISNEALNPTGNVSITADAETTPTATVFSLSIGAGAAGQSVSNATDQPVVSAYVGSNANINAGGNINLQGSHDVGTGSGARATSESPTVALAGYGGAVPTASSLASVYSYVGTGGTLQAAGTITILSNSNNYSDSEANSTVGTLIGKGQSTSTSSVYGSNSAYVNGTITGTQGLTISSVTSSTGIANGGSVGSGLAGSIGVVSNAAVSPTTQALVGSGASVTATGPISILSQSLDGSSATGEGKPNNLLAIGIVQANSTLTPYISAYIGSNASVSTSGSIQIQAVHNYNANSTTPISGKNALVLADASSGGFAALGNAQATVANATANASDYAYVGSGASVQTGGNLGLIALSDNSATGTGASAAAAALAAGVVVSILNSSGTTQAYLNNAGALNISGNLNVQAMGTEAAASTANAAAGGVGVLTGAIAAAIDKPQTQATIAASQPITVGGTANIQAAALGSSKANGVGTAGGLFIQVGVSQSTSTWQPTVKAYIGPGTTLTTGGDLNIDAYNNYNLNGVVNTSNSANGTGSSSGGSALSGNGAGINVTTNSNVVAEIGAGAVLAAGNNLNVIALSQDNLTAGGGAVAAGIASLGAVNVTGTMLSQTLAMTDPSTSGNPTKISAGSTTTPTPWAVLPPGNTITFMANGAQSGIGERGRR